jgi:SAM-dependent methyltransferase
MAQDSWENLSSAYEAHSVREDSFDTLLDYPAQKKAIGDISGKSILDLGCGSGRKAFEFVIAGAEKVVGIDVSSQFIDAWKSRDKPKNLFFYRGDISHLERITEIANERFNIVTCFQALGYSTDLSGTIAFIREHSKENARFILTTAHPFRFAIEKFEAAGMPYGVAYRDENEYSYTSTWDSNVIVSHRTPMISTCLNTVLRNGFWLDAIHEPDLSNEQKARYPTKAEWLAKYIGIIVYEFTAE